MAAEAPRSWRDALTPQQRASVQQHIFTRLAALVQGVSEQDLWARSVTFEEREFARASSQEEYLHRIAAGLQNAERAVNVRSNAPRQVPTVSEQKQQQPLNTASPQLKAPQPERMNPWRSGIEDAMHTELSEQRKRCRSVGSNSSTLNQQDARPSRAYSMTSFPGGADYRWPQVQGSLQTEHERSPNSLSFSSAADGTRAPYRPRSLLLDGQHLSNTEAGGRASTTPVPVKPIDTPLSQQLFSPQQKEVIRTVLDAYHGMPDDLRARGFDALPPHVVERLAQVFPNDPIVFAAFAAAMAVGPAQLDIVYMRFVAALNAARGAAARYALSKSLSMAVANFSAHMPNLSLSRSASHVATDGAPPASPSMLRSVSAQSIEQVPHESPTRIFAELADFQAREGHAFRSAFGVIRTALQRHTDPFLREKHMENIQGILNLIQMNPSKLGSSRCPTLADIQRARGYVRRWLALLHDVLIRNRNTSNVSRRGEVGRSSPKLERSFGPRESADPRDLNSAGSISAARAPLEAQVPTSLPMAAERNAQAQSCGLDRAAPTVADMVDSNRSYIPRVSTPMDMQVTNQLESFRGNQSSSDRMDANVSSGLQESLGTNPYQISTASKMEGSSLEVSSISAVCGESKSPEGKCGVETFSANHSPTQIPVMVPSLVTIVDENGACVTLPTNGSTSHSPNATNEPCLEADRISFSEEKGEVLNGNTPASLSVPAEQPDSKPLRNRCIEILGQQLELALASFLPRDKSMNLEHTLDWELGGPAIRLSATIVPSSSPNLEPNLVPLHFPILLMAYPSPRYLERQCRGIAITFRSLLSPAENDEWAFQGARKFLKSIRQFCPAEEARKINRALERKVLHLRVLLLYVNISVYDMVRYWIESIYEFAPTRNRTLAIDGTQAMPDVKMPERGKSGSMLGSPSNAMSSSASLSQKTPSDSGIHQMEGMDCSQDQRASPLFEALCRQWEAANGTH